MLPIFLLFILSFPVFAAELESVSSIPSSTLDSLGDTAGGYGSAAAYDRKAGFLYLTTDRGPGDGKIDFSPRLYALPLRSSSDTPNSKDSLNLNSNLKLTASSTARLYKDPDGKPFTGLIPDSCDPEPPQAGYKFFASHPGMTIREQKKG